MENRRTVFTGAPSASADLSARIGNLLVVVSAEDRGGTSELIAPFESRGHPLAAKYISEEENSCKRKPEKEKEIFEEEGGIYLEILGLDPERL